MIKKEERSRLMKKYYSYFSSKKWRKAKSVLKQIIKHDPNNFWICTSLSSVYYEMKKYKKALKYSEKAYKLNPNSPLVLWDYAGVLYMLNKEKKAIKLWNKIIDMGEKKIGLELTTEGIMWARSLINDSKFRIGEAYYYIKKDKKARDYLEEHLANRQRGMKSLYKKSDIRNMLNKVDLELNGCQSSD